MSAPQVQMHVVHVEVDGVTREVPVELEAFAEALLAGPRSGTRCDMESGCVASPKGARPSHIAGLEHLNPTPYMYSFHRMT